MSAQKHQTPLPQRDPALDVSQNHYWRYHQLEPLLACKQPVTDSVDEDLFIAVHQVCELAFHQMVLDFERCLEALQDAFRSDERPLGDVSEAAYFLRRILHFWDVVNRTMPILNGMRGFAEFRTGIGPGSGFQSWQFRHVEIMSGVKKVYWKGGTADAEGRPHAAETEFERKFGADIANWLKRHVRHSLRFYWDELRQRAEPQMLRQSEQAAEFITLLQRYEAAQKLFHGAHIALAVRQLAIVGVEIGTGGSSFKDYLQKYGREHAPLFEGLPEAG